MPSFVAADALENRIVDALRHHPIEPALFAEFCEELPARRTMSVGWPTFDRSGSGRGGMDRSGRSHVVDMIRRGGAAGSLGADIPVMEQRKRELEDKACSRN